MITVMFELSAGYFLDYEKWKKKKKKMKTRKFLKIQKVFTLLSQKTRRSGEIFRFREQRRRTFSIFA